MNTQHRPSKPRVTGSIPVGRARRRPPLTGAALRADIARVLLRVGIPEAEVRAALS